MPETPPPVNYPYIQSAPPVVLRKPAAALVIHRFLCFRFQVSDAPMQVMEDTEKFVLPPFGGSGPVGFQVESQTALSA
jgi:hypothetical protein